MIGWRHWVEEEAHGRAGASVNITQGRICEVLLFQETARAYGCHVFIVKTVRTLGSERIKVVGGLASCCIEDICEGGLTSMGNINVI